MFVPIHGVCFSELPSSSSFASEPQHLNITLLHRPTHTLLSLSHLRYLCYEDMVCVCQICENTLLKINENNKTVIRRDPFSAWMNPFDFWPGGICPQSSHHQHKMAASGKHRPFLPSSGVLAPEVEQQVCRQFVQLLGCFLHTCHANDEERVPKTHAIQTPELLRPCDFPFHINILGRTCAQIVPNGFPCGPRKRSSCNLWWLSSHRLPQQGKV